MNDGTQLGIAYDVGHLETLDSKSFMILVHCVSVTFKKKILLPLKNCNGNRKTKNIIVMFLFFCSCCS